MATKTSRRARLGPSIAALLLGACGPTDVGGGPTLADLRGQWEGNPTNGLPPDALSVDAEGHGTAVLAFVKSSTAFVVQLTFDATPTDNGFDCAFECEGDETCSPYAFEADCVIVDDELRCVPAPGWYPSDRIVLVRPED